MIVARPARMTIASLSTCTFTGSALRKRLDAAGSGGAGGSLRRGLAPDDTRIVVLADRKDVGRVEVRPTGARVIRRLPEESQGMAGSVSLVVFRNNQSARFYEWLGFETVREMPTRFVMRRGIAGSVRSRRTGR